MQGSTQHATLGHEFMGVGEAAAPHDGQRSARRAAGTPARPLWCRCFMPGPLSPPPSLLSDATSDHLRTPPPLLSRGSRARLAGGAGASLSSLSAPPSLPSIPRYLSTVEQVGPEVRDRQVGDRVVCAFDIACGKVRGCGRLPARRCSRRLRARWAGGGRIHASRRVHRSRFTGGMWGFPCSPIHESLAQGPPPCPASPHPSLPLQCFYCQRQLYTSCVSGWGSVAPACTVAAGGSGTCCACTYSAHPASMPARPTTYRHSTGPWCA